jgi:hypothetical protein
MSSSLGAPSPLAARSLSSAYMDMTNPGVQNPHWLPWLLARAAWTGCRPWRTLPRPAGRGGGVTEGGSTCQGCMHEQWHSTCTHDKYVTRETENWKHDCCIWGGMVWGGRWTDEHAPAALVHQQHLASCICMQVLHKSMHN